MRRGRVGAWCKWAGAGASALITTMWISSYWDWPMLFVDSGTVDGFLFIGDGTATIAGHRTTPSGRQSRTQGVWAFDREAVGLDWPTARWWPSISQSAWITMLVVPLWLPFGLLALPTAYLFYSDARRRAPGLCPKCRYDRSGLAAGAKCPECGANHGGPP